MVDCARRSNCAASSAARCSTSRILAAYLRSRFVRDYARRPRSPGGVTQSPALLFERIHARMQLRQEMRRVAARCRRRHSRADTSTALLQPRQINRIGVRFINRIDIPATNNLGIDLDVYFHVAPRVPPELPQVMSTYFVRLAVPFESPGGVLILTLTAIPPPATGLVSALLDIDAVVQDIQMDALTAWRTVNDLRDVKNAAFEASITDAARELFR